MKIMENILEKWAFGFNNNTNLLGRIMVIVGWALLALIGISSLIFIILYFVTGVFLLDILYWVISGKTVFLAKLLN
jgi:hypothetical protein